MHSRHQLRADDFVIEPGPGEAPDDAPIAGWQAGNRAAIVAPDPCGDLLRVAGIVLAWTHRFYDRPAAEAADFYDYPSHYVVGGEDGAAPRLLGPDQQAGWSAAWCELDVWPSIRHLVAHPEPAGLFAAALMIEPSHLLWPSRLPWPRDVELAFGPGDRKVRRLMRARLEDVILYGQDLQDRPGAWRLRWHGGAGELTQAAARLLPGSREPGPRSEWFVSVPVDPFLGLDPPRPGRGRAGA